MTNKEALDLSKPPVHIAIIMDGNGRWAKKRGLPRAFGHREGTKNVRRITEACSELGIKVLTLYAFSTENWIRPKAEVNALMTLLKVYLKSELKTMMKNNIRFSTIGDVSRLPDAAFNEIKKVKLATKDNTGLVLNLALNYGSRQEIVSAVNSLIKSGAAEVDEKEFSDSLYTRELPDPDLLIRTSGEMRLSNFMLWQLAYTELVITPVLWPDFSKKDLIAAISEYQKRERRYGGV